MQESSSPDLLTERLTGSVARIVYQHPDSGWAVVRLDLDEGGEATLVGDLAQVFEGEHLEVEGTWVDDRRFGRQFRVTRAASIRPASKGAIKRYLASGAVPGIGPELAARLVAKFGKQTLEIIDREPQRLLAVRGIGKVRLASIREAWQEQARERSVRMFLQEIGLGTALANRIVRLWGRDAESRIRANPYELAAADGIRGIGFRRADRIAMQLPGWRVDGEGRARAAIVHVLEEQANQGHCFVPDEGLVRLTQRLLELDDDQVVRGVLETMLQGGELVAEQLGDDEADALGITAAVEEGLPRAVWLPAFQGAEVRVTRRLRAIAAAAAGPDLPGSLPPSRQQSAADWVEAQLGVELGEDQERALKAVLGNKVLIVTGGPGTGKTTLIDAVVRCSKATDARIRLAAPTGRAAKRLAEATGHEAQTIHRLLEYRPQAAGFARNTRNPLEVDLLIVDEASMIDLFLMDALVAAVPPNAALLLVGDADQLPPVGPGAVLRDLLASKRLPIVSLTEIYRQARASLIVRNAHRVNAGRMPEGLGMRRLDGVGRPNSADGVDEVGQGDGGASEEDRDFYFIEEADGTRARELVLALVGRRIPARFGLDARRDVQVVAPMHRGPAGVAQLNRSLQQMLNPGTGGYPVGDVTLRVGDRVIQLRNDYDREVFNGDIGQVTAASSGGDDGGLVVEFDGRRVAYDADAASDLALAYAISVHKSQGSEYPAVVAVLLPEHYVMLQRNLLYTALTRAKRLAVLVGSSRSVAQAVRNAAPMRRCTRLAARLAGEAPLPDLGESGATV